MWVRVGCLSLGKIGVKIGNTPSRVSINSWESTCWYTIPTGPRLQSLGVD